MKAIVTKYLPCTNTKPSRIRASAHGVPPVTISYHGEAAGDDPHAGAAKALCVRYGWHGSMVRGHAPDETYVFVFAFAGEDYIPAPAIEV